MPDGRFFAPSVSNWQSMMYLGAAMSVTAFPVLARIIQERGIAGTALGTLALRPGPTMRAWCLLTIVRAGPLLGIVLDQHRRAASIVVRFLCARHARMFACACMP